MNLVTPDSGLLFWMVLIFAVMFFLLWKFGFPVITDMVDRRSEHIDKSLALAEEAEQRMRDLAGEQQALLEKTRREHQEIIKEATRTRTKIIDEAREQAGIEADRLLNKAKMEIAAEKETALMEIRSKVAELSVEIAGKVLRKSLSDDAAQMAYLDGLLSELTENKEEK